MRILYTSLFPRLPYKQHEQENLEFFMDSVKYHNYNNFKYIIASAHSFMLKNSYDYFLDTDFTYNEKMNEERGHEISFSKQKLFQLSNEIMKEQEIDYLFYIDSDMMIDSKDVVELCKALEYKENTFVNIPYVLRDLKKVSNSSFGCYIIPFKILKENPDLYEVIYRTKIVDDQICRIGAPDCNIREELIRRGYKELNAHNINTRH
jgi:hypothetical protein